MTITPAKPSSSGNARVWVKCGCGRRLTIRRSKLAGWECAKCKSVPGAKKAAYE